MRAARNSDRTPRSASEMQSCWLDKAAEQLLVASGGRARRAQRALVRATTQPPPAAPPVILEIRARRAAGEWEPYQHNMGTRLPGNITLSRARPFVIAKSVYPCARAAAAQNWDGRLAHKEVASRQGARSASHRVRSFAAQA